MGKKVLFVDTTHPYLPEELTRLGFECDLPTGIDREGIEKIIHQYTGVIVRSRILFDELLLKKAINLRFIGRVGAGMEGIDVDYAVSKGIICLNAPEGNRDALAEHTTGMLLALFNKLLKADAEVRKGIWNREENRGMELMGKTIGIIGYGNMGSAFARRLNGFDVNVIAYDKYKNGYSDSFVVEKSLQDLKQEADIVSLHVPLTAETHYMVDELFIGQFRKKFYIINTSRGKVLKTTDLLQGIRTGKILGAVLDVIEFEDYTFEELNKGSHSQVFQELVNSDKVILSPHVAGFSAESPYKMAKVLVGKIKSELGL
jgi:D-3-phosphoglycerate dehydrogenase